MLPMLKYFMNTDTHICKFAPRVLSDWMVFEQILIFDSFHLYAAHEMTWCGEGL